LAAIWCSTTCANCLKIGIRGEYGGNDITTSSDSFLLMMLVCLWQPKQQLKHSQSGHSCPNPRTYIIIGIHTQLLMQPHPPGWSSPAHPLTHPNDRANVSGEVVAACEVDLIVVDEYHTTLACVLREHTEKKNVHSERYRVLQSSGYLILRIKKSGLKIYLTSYINTTDSQR